MWRMDQFLAPQKISLSIGGMTCASCVARVEKSLARVPGVRNVAVNLATETAQLEAASGTGTPELIAAVAQAGYRAARLAERPAKDNRPLWELAAAAILSAPLLLTMAVTVPGWLQLALAAPVQFWLGARFYVAGFRALRAGSGNMDLLVALGTSAAFALSVGDLLTGGPLYFESAAIVITLIRLGKFLEGRAKTQAAQAVTGLAKLRPSLAHLAAGADIPAAALRPGDEIELRPGERVPADSEILTGAGSLDESALTGESLPVFRQPGAAVLAGSLNLDAVLRVKVTAAAGESLLDRMGRLIESAQASKPKVQRLADQVASWFVPVVLVIALITFAAWLFFAHAPISAAIINAVSVLVIACPCALGLATPAAILAGTGIAAKYGILIRNADAIDLAARVNFVAFDKTGTLTEGRPRLTEIRVFQGSEASARDIAAALSAADTHPLSAPLRRPGVTPADSVRALPGRGIEGVVGGARYLLGSARLVRDAGGAPPDMPGATISYLATPDGQVIAAFAFADTPRDGAREAVRRLQDQGIGTMLLSGDRAEAADAIGASLGITQVVSNASPEQKLAAIEAKRRAGQIVAMVGDGVNDAAALAAADIGIAIGAAADVAIETADFTLLRPAPGLVADLLDLSRRTRRILREGLFWAVIYNVIGIPLAALGFLSPMLAGAAMAASSVCVLTNALRLRRWRPA
jgi:Cu+-exporting ATPase